MYLLDQKLPKLTDARATVIASIIAGVVAIIGFSPSLIALMEHPNINTEFKSGFLANPPPPLGGLFIFKNLGNAAATNLRITITAPTNIIHLNISSSEAYTPENKTRSLALIFPRFSSDAIAYVAISLSHPRLGNYTVYIASDQGGTPTLIFHNLPPTPGNPSETSNQLLNLFNSLNKPAVILFVPALIWVLSDPLPARYLAARMTNPKST